MKKIFLLLAASQMLLFACRKNAQDTAFTNRTEAADTMSVQTIGASEQDKILFAARLSTSLKFRELGSGVFTALDRWDQLIPFSGDTTAYIKEFARLSTTSPFREDIAAIHALNASLHLAFPDLKKYARNDQKYIISQSFKMVRPMRHASCKYGYDNDRDDCRVDAGTETIFNIGGMTIFGGTGFLAGMWVQGGILAKRYVCMQRAMRNYKTCIINERVVVIGEPVEGKDFKLIHCRYVSGRRICDTVWINKLPKLINR